MPKQKKKNVFYEFAGYYDVLYSNKDYEGEVEFIVKKFKERRQVKGSTALVLGCGTGNHSRILDKKGFNIVGVDASEKLLEIANEKVDGKFVLGTLPDIPVDNTSFDLVLLPFTVINYLTKQRLKKTFRNIKKILSDSGVLIFDNGHFPLEKEQKIGDIYTERILGTPLVRKGQFKRIDESAIQFTSMILDQQKGNIFQDNHRLFEHKDEFIVQALKQLGFDVEINANGYDTDESKVHSTVFCAF